VALEHDDELVSPEACGNVAVPDVLLDDPRRPLDELRPREMAVPVVGRLEVVGVQHTDGIRLPVALAELFHVQRERVEASHVVEFREVVGERELFHLAMRSLDLGREERPEVGEEDKREKLENPPCDVVITRLLSQCHCRVRGDGKGGHEAGYLAPEGEGAGHDDQGDAADEGAGEFAGVPADKVEKEEEQRQIDAAPEPAVWEQLRGQPAATRK
jgi:hypothetical protein